MKAEDFLKGQILLINKPRNWTSFDVVNKIRGVIRYTFKLKDIRVGHAGTLDPLATGLLIICTGKATQKISELQDLEKEYTGTFMLGATTPSYDLETAIEHRQPIVNIDKKMIQQLAKKFIGPQFQIPPTFSAKKIDGKRSYDLARQGHQWEVRPVPIIIHDFETGDIHLPLVDFKVVCSKGTYIRSIANDFGKELGCGALLSSLCRTRIGKYKLKDAKEISAWEKNVQRYAPVEDTRSK